MAKATTNTIEVTAKASRKCREICPICSADIRAPRPYPRPTRTAEKRADHRQGNSDGDEPGHHPPGKRPLAAPPRDRAAILRWETMIGAEHEQGDDLGRHEHSPSTKECQQASQRDHHRKKNPQRSFWIARPERGTLNIDVELRDDHQRDHNERGNEDPSNRRRQLNETQLT